MASICAKKLLLFAFFSVTFSLIFSATVVEDLNNLHPPHDFNTTISNNCKLNPSLRYCNLSHSPSNLHQIFKFTIVASHLCNVSNNPNCKESFPNIDLKNRPKIAPLYLSFDFFWKFCPLTVVSIDIANNSLKDSFPCDVLHCSQIQSLDMSFNQFTGEVPIQNISSLVNLSFLNLSYNHFSERGTADADFFKRFNSSSFLHSGLVPDHNKFSVMAVIAFFGLVLLFIAVVVLVCLPRFMKREDKFTPAMLKSSTNGFSRGNLVATREGVRIYKGVTVDGTEVRIDVYKDDLSRQEHDNFVAECEILAQLNHKNLVRVLGWCDDKRSIALIAEWVDGGNVESWLVNCSPPWKDRVEVLVKVTGGMSYLQEEWPEVGYDLKSNSILLKNDREPMISRFKVGDHINSTKKVYKFGLLILEMVSNKRPRKEFDGREPAFVEWMSIRFSRKLWNMIVDEKMNTDAENKNSLERATQLGLMCTSDITLGQRPSLDQVAQIMYSMYNSVIHHNGFHHHH